MLCLPLGSQGGPTATADANGVAAIDYSIGGFSLRQTAAVRLPLIFH